VEKDGKGGRERTYFLGKETRGVEEDLGHLEA